ncbi:hypothetical protein ES703_49834 [subsurface metagenome]
MLAVGEHALHAVGVAPSTHVALELAGTRAGRQPHPPAGPPGRGSVDGQIGCDDAAGLSPAQQLGNRGPWVTLFLGAEEGNECLAERHRGFGPLAASGCEGLDTTGRVRGSPALQGTHAHLHGASVGVRMLSVGNLAHRSTRW